MMERFIKSDVYDEKYYFYNLPAELHADPYQQIPGRMLEIFELRKIEPDMHVLDVGMGRGEICVHAAQRGARAWGIDYSEAAVRIAERFKPQLPLEIRERITYSQGNAKALDFTDGFFDIVTMTDVVEHLYPEELQRAFTEARRVLKPGGSLLIHTAPNRWYTQYGYWVYRLFRKLNDRSHVPHPRKGINEVVHVNEQSYFQLRQALQQSGFKQPAVFLRNPPLQSKNPAKQLGHQLFYRSPAKYFLAQSLLAAVKK